MLGALHKSLALLLGVTQLSYAQPLVPELQPEPAVAATIGLFDTYPVVGIGEIHSAKELGDFYFGLVRHPAFAKDVGNVVFEFGNASFQPLVDRYLAGENVPYEKVKRAWTTTVAAGGPPHEISVMYGQFYRAVRAVNQTLPESQRIKVWLGDPPVDPNDALAYSDERFPDRDAFFAEIVLEKVLARGEKALLIIGAGHLMSGDSAATLLELEHRQPFDYDVKAFVDAYHPGKLFVIQTYWGLPKPVCTRRLEAQLEPEPIPSLVPLQHTALADFLNDPRCTADNLWGDLTRAWGDGYLYLGRSSELTLSPLPGEPEMPYMDMLRQYDPELKELKEPSSNE